MAEQLAKLAQHKNDLLAQLAGVHKFEGLLASRMISSMHPVIDINNKTLLTQENIKLRIKALAHELMDSLKSPPILISVMDGALPFAAELQAELSALNCDFQYETIQVSSYIGTKSGKLSIHSALKIDVGGKDIIVVDDVCDTGKTYDALRLKLLALGALSIKLMVLVDKQQKRLNDESHPSFVGFTVSSDAFVAGWGMDYEGLLRNYVQNIGGVDPSTLPNPDEAKLLHSKKSLNHQLQDCIAYEKNLQRSLKVSRTPLQQDSFYYNCLIGLALAGVGSALMVYGIHSENTSSFSFGTALVVGGITTGLYNYGLFSSKEGNKTATQAALQVVTI
jgi:hypoxanthine phosphoribosyltransferase